MRPRTKANPGVRLGMAFDAWPAADQVAWNSAFEVRRPMPGRPSGARMREPSKLAIATCYARWLVWLTKNDAAALKEGPGARATEDRVIDYLHDLYDEISIIALFGYACRLKRALQLMAPDGDWSWFTPLLKYIHSEVGETPLAARPFVPADQLSAFGIELMKRASGGTALGARAQAEMFRNGLIIAFLAARPLRIKNMVQLEIGKHFIETEGGYQIKLSPSDMKTKAWVAFSMPDALAPYIRRYLHEYRPVLAAGPDFNPAQSPDGGFLLLSRTGGKYPVATFEDMTAKLTMDRFQQRILPHGFRHCVATSIAEFNPEDMHIIRIILGHAKLAMAETYYIRAKGTEAARKVQAVVMNTRKALAKDARAAAKQL